MNVKAILNYIPESQLDYLSIKTNVNHQVKKLDGQFIFQLLLFSILTSKRTSLRVIEEICNSTLFQSCLEGEEKQIKYNSLSDRLATINSDFFKELFEHCHRKFSHFYDDPNEIICVDSTMVALSAKLLKQGMKVGSKGDKKHVKYSIMLLKDIPVHCEIYTDQKLLSENWALGQAIKNSVKSKESIVVFDRGLADRKTFDDFTRNDTKFVTRANLNVRYHLIKSNKVTQLSLSNGILEDLVVKLVNGDTKKTKENYRLIKTKFDNGEFFFLTNMQDLEAFEIAKIYKRRWEIETFFKFIKQELNFSHFISRNENGIKVMMYMTLITAILLAVYKKLNNLEGFKIPKLKFSYELETEIIREIVIQCGGDPNKSRLFNSP